MNFRPRTKLLAACVGAALAQWGSGTALADSAVGVDTAIGNALNPPGRSSMPRPIADDAFDTVRRSPSGQLYGLPPAPPEEFRKTDSGWEFIGGIEFGVLGGAGKQNAKYREYKDFKSGAYLDYFELEGEKPDTAHFLQAFGGGLGHEDQFIGLQFGRYNDWKLRSFYNETPHVFSTTFKPIYRNTGTSKPALDNGTPGGNGATTAAALLAYSKTLPDTEVGLVRKKGGTRLDLTLTDKWKTYASITSEKRTGERPFGLQDGGVEAIEPIDYETNDLAAGVSYTDRLTAFNLRTSVSLFRNNIDYFFPRKALVGANAAPTTVTGAANSTTGIDFASYTLAPDNEAYNVKGEYSRKLPDFFKGRFSAAVAWGSSRQDDKIRTPLEPNSPNFSSAGIVQAAANGVAWDPNNWNGVNGSPTSRATAGQRIDSTLYNLSLLLHPLDELGVKGTFRHYETDNKSGTYYAYNPLTGQWGYGIQEGAFNTVAPLAIGGVGCQPAPGRPIVPGCTGAAYAAAAFANSRAMYMPPRDYKQTNYTVSADYDLGDASSLEATLERENFSHTFRERDKTWEDKIKLTYADRSLGDATLRASYEQDRKRGSFYDPLVNSRGGLNWFAIYGIPYSRATLQDIIANSGAVINGVTNPLAGTLTAAGVVTAGSVLNWLTLAGNFNSGGMMKTDQADRDQSIANVRLNYMARPDLDIGTMVQARRVRYPTNTLAAQKDNLTSVNFDVNYQPALGTLISAYYSRQDGRQRQRENFSSNVQARTYAYRMCGGDGVNPLALTVDNIDCFLNNQRDPGLDMMMNTKSTTDVFGFNVAHHFGPIGVSASYTYTESLTRISQIYGLTALTLAQQAIVNSYGAWPDMTMKQHSLELNLILPIDKKTAARFVYHYDKLKLRDWHYDYRALNTTTTFIPADYGPQNYTADMFGVFLQMKL
ncbi:MAG: MtrB/PioB family outer membrane beta-barrel protein [Rhodocyclales bacterium]|nr:MtrB/PioB family outer membrane beta-barrel protein [Rhodocyclales bacterium]